MFVGIVVVSISDSRKNGVFIRMVNFILKVFVSMLLVIIFMSLLVSLKVFSLLYILG